MTVGQLFKNIWNNKKLRNVIILITLLIILVIVTIINLSPPEPRKSERVLICDQCKEAVLLKFVNIRDAQCPKCKLNSMKYGMKCDKCEYEFPYNSSPLSEKQKKTMNSVRAQRILDRRCPNCGDVEVFPLSNALWKKAHGK